MGIEINLFSAAGSVSVKSVYPGISRKGAATREQNFRLVTIILVKLEIEVVSAQAYKDYWRRLSTPARWAGKP